jgi:hypothetical protein
MMKNTLPQVGDQVTVVVRNDNQGMQAWRAATSTYQGCIVASPKWLDDGNFCMTGEALHPVRILNYAKVVSMQQGGQDVTVPVIRKAAEPVVKTYEIAGSRGNSYTVTFQNGAWKCPCVAGGFGKQCRHIKEATLQAA